MELDPPEPVVLTNYRWSKGTVNKDNFGILFTSRAEFVSKSKIRVVTRNACNVASKPVLKEFEAWIESLKFDKKLKDNIKEYKHISTLIKTCVNKVRKRSETTEFEEMERYIKNYWKLTFKGLMQGFERSDNEDNLIDWFAHDLKKRVEYHIRFKAGQKDPKLTIDNVRLRLENFTKPLRLHETFNFRSKRIYIQQGARKVGILLGSELFESASETSDRQGLENREKRRAAGLPLKALPASQMSAEDKHQIKRGKFLEELKQSDASQLLKSAIVDFKKTVDNPDYKYDFDTTIKPLNVFLRGNSSVQCSVSGPKANTAAINPLLTDIEVTFDVDQIIDSCSKYSDNDSYSEVIIGQLFTVAHGGSGCLRGGDGTIHSRIDSEMFDLENAEVFSAFQEAFVDAASKVYCKKSKSDP